MGKKAPKSDLEKDDLKNFFIGLTEAKELKITKEDLKGIKEVIPNVKYKIRTTSGDNRKAETVKGTLFDAVKRKRELVVEQFEKNEKAKDYKNISMNEGIDEFIKYQYKRVERGSLDMNTYHDYVRKIDSFIREYFKGYKIIDITGESIENFLDWMRQHKSKHDPTQTISEQTVDNHLKLLSAIINYFYRKKHWIPLNPLVEVENKPVIKKTKKELNYFQIDDATYALKCLERYADIRLRTFMNLIFSLGCRREEACGLRWCDIDFNEKSVDYNYATTSSISAKFLREHGLLDEGDDENTINKDKTKKYKRIRTKDLKTSNSYRTNFLSDNALKNLKHYYEFKIAYGLDIKPDDQIFTNWINDDVADPSKLSEQWRTFKRKYNIKDVDLHRIRHTVASILEKSCVPKKDIARMLGNTERVLEEYYTHVDVSDLKRLRNTLDEKLYKNVETVDVNIELAAKILNELPMEALSGEELNILDLVSDDKINSDNYLSNIQRIKTLILDTDSKLSFFIDSNNENLDIKITTYKRFCDNSIIKVKKIKDITINRNILNF